jgi:predicted nucleic acid-binding protein
MFRSVKSLLYLSFVIIGMSLLLVIVLGVRQYRLNDQYTEISSLSERTLFGFSTIRDQVTEMMISGSFEELKTIIPDIEQLNTLVSKLYDYKMIPAQYKLAMADTIDLSGLVISLRRLEVAESETTSGLELQREMRRIGENLIKVDRIITGHIRNSVISFQLTVIGTMGILISCASFVLIVLYKRGVSPLLELSRQAAAGEVEEVQHFQCPSEAGRELQVLVESVNTMLASRQSPDQSGDGPAEADHELLSQTVNETTNSLNAVINYAELLLESGTDELSAEQREMVDRIVASGERIGEQWQRISREFDRS